MHEHNKKKKNRNSSSGWIFFNDPVIIMKYICSQLASNVKSKGKVLKLIIIWVTPIMGIPTKWHLQPAKAQIRLCIHAVWSEPSQFAWECYESQTIYGAKSGVSDQTKLLHMPLCWNSRDIAQIPLTKAVTNSCSFVLYLNARYMNFHKNKSLTDIDGVSIHKVETRKS